MKVIFLLALFLVSCLALEEFEESKPSQIKSSCEDQCSTKFSSTENSNVLDNCLTGCRFLTLHESTELDPFSLDLTNSLQNCNNDCKESFGENDSSCNLGCSFQVPIAKERRRKLSFPLKPLFGNDFPDFPQSSLFPGFSMDFSSPGSIFNQMHNQMNEMMKKMVSGMGPFGSSGGGKVIVIKSGPGYHEEKTYHFNALPSEDKEESSYEALPFPPKEQSMNNDMIFKPNPLDRWNMNGKNEVEEYDPKNDVEVFAPKVDNSAAIADDETKDKEKPLFITVDLFKPFMSRDEEDFSAIQKQIQDFGRSDWLEAPRLPEIGLQSRQHICAKERKDMNWSEWAFCLHKQIGLPCWVTALTLAMGILFFIWICFVMPRNAPKQTVKKGSFVSKSGKLLVKNKKSEMALIGAPGEYRKMSPPSYDKIDTPPAYDDLSFLHVAIPVHQATDVKVEKSDETEKKVPLEHEKA